MIQNKHEQRLFQSFLASTLQEVDGLFLSAVTAEAVKHYSHCG